MPEADAEGGTPLDLDNHIAKEMTETISILFVSEFLAPAKKPKEFPPRIPPAPSCGAENKPKKLFKKLSLGFANPPPAKLLRKTESAVYLAFSRTSASAEALCFAQRRFSARGTLVFRFEKSSRK
jgi:hypothetical protein